MADLTIDLLPWREAALARRRQRFWVLMGVAAGAGIAVVASGWWWFDRLHERQVARNRFLEQRIAKLEEEIAEIGRLKELLSGILARKAVIESLETARVEPVVLLDRLPRLLPSGVALEQIERKGADLTLKGLARSNGAVSEAMRVLEGEGVFTEVRLIETQAVEGERETVVRFTLTCRFNREALANALRVAKE
ncbi:MAG: PilN domain-containing protein [Hydrogenophilus sp.]|nr:PilN domain-containing protein [Hydrogenophilus sp.]